VRNQFFNSLLPITSFLLKTKSNLTFSTCFHRVSDEYSPGYPPMKVEDFEKLIQFFSKNFELVDLSDSAPEKGYRKMVVTFDDGYKDFQTNSLPILKHYKCPVTQNVITDVLDSGETHWTQKLSRIAEFCDVNEYALSVSKLLSVSITNKQNKEQLALEIFHLLKNKDINFIEKFIGAVMVEFKLKKEIFIPMLVWDDLVQISNETKLVKWGCHTKSHQNLGDVKDVKLLETEVLLAKNKMEEQLNMSIDRFAFPNGHANQISFDFVFKHFKWIQFTEMIPNNIVNSNRVNVITRNQPYYNSVSENIHKSIGFHNLIRK
jgi:peptidoglycan/xylan/chitin deacetylase (PgdA/CDA1 family)